ncbi:MAG: hypothetical protein GEV06_08625 [Luteitalea sp.]|nr:hypothetical protein [Luteitalea sp.]
MLACAVLMASSIAGAQAQPHALELRKGDRIILLGNTQAERMQHFNYFETLLMTRFPELELTMRNLGWSADTITLQPRPLNFPAAPTHLEEQKADVILAFFGVNESFEGDAGLPTFERDLDAYVKEHLQRSYNGTSAPRVVLVSPIAHERLPRLEQVDVASRNRDLASYTEVMRRVAVRNGVMFADLFTPTKRLIEQAAAPLTINGIHLNENGHRLVAGILMEALGLGPDHMRPASGAQLEQLEALRGVVREKNQQFFYRWRPVNAEYVVGRRVDPFGSVNFPPEMTKLDRMVEELDREIWRSAEALEGIRYP